MVARLSSPPPPEYRSVRHNPWWIPPFLGGVPASLAPEHLRLLGVLTFALFFENYDISVLANALPQLAASFGLSKSALGDFTSITRLGALPAFLFVPLADRIGRRRVVLLSVLGMSLGSLLTASSQTAVQFVLFQFATRTFLITAAVVAVVIVTEEFPAEHRGWGIGMLAGVAAIGFGMGALMYGFVNRLPLGWRALYLVGVVPLLLFPWLRRGVTETRRFTRARGETLEREGIGAALSGALRPLAQLFREHPRRAVALGLIGSLSSAGISVSFQFISEFLQTMRGWTPGGFAVMSIFFGAFGIIGNPLAGRLADRFGRRTIIIGVLLTFPLVTTAFYAGPAALVALPWTAMVFLNMASGVMLRALTTELFPTAFRGAAGGTQALLETLGAVASLFLYSRAMEWLDNQELVIPLLSLATLAAAAAVFLVPETARRELEQISGERPDFESR
jgi:AAHS family 4-hydroxybenzoate transporter-like MFS transporter